LVLSQSQLASATSDQDLNNTNQDMLNQDEMIVEMGDEEDEDLELVNSNIDSHSIMTRNSVNPTL